MKPDDVQAHIERLVGAFKRELISMREEEEPPNTRALVHVAAWLLSGVIALDRDYDPATILQWATDDMNEIMERNAALLRGVPH
jgi:hypothetical protein